MKMSNFIVKCAELLSKYGNLEVVCIDYAVDYYDGEFDVYPNVQLTVVEDPRDTNKKVFSIE
jgi:hypothetical protein